MKTCWLHRQNHQDCILFMAGWGMTPDPFMDIPAGPVDILMVYDYRTVDDWNIVSFLQENTYHRVHLLAWSMGVRTAAMLLAEHEQDRTLLTSAVAVGGTCQAIHDQFGIPNQAFDWMIRGFSPILLNAFYRSMFDQKQEVKRFLDGLRTAQRPDEELRQELIVLRAACREQQDVPDIFTHRIITGRDRIVPARNQQRSWKRQACTFLPLPHFPFYHWADWAALLQELTGLDISDAA
ncbi:MAG: alpha/beta fold hydrolase [Candidatus Electrothrix sp. YB6]